MSNFKAVYDGIVVKVNEEEDIYTVYNVLDDEYKLVHKTSGKVYTGYTEAIINLYIEDGDWIVLDGDIISNTKPEAVHSPKHYSVFEYVEAIQVIASSMTEDQFYGYCFGNILKYRLRAGGKDDVMQELGKADRYQGLYTENKHLCKGEAL